MKPPALTSEEQAAYDQLAHRVLSKHVVPICRDDDQRRPEQIGTGLLVAGPTRSHLVSAAHVLTETNPHFPSAPGIKRALKEPITLKNDDIDLAIMELKLAPPPYPGADKYPLSVNALLRAATPRQRKQYLITGFPSRKSEVSRKRRQFTTTLYSNLCVSADADRYTNSSYRRITTSFSTSMLGGCKGPREVRPFRTHRV